MLKKWSSLIILLFFAAGVLAQSNQSNNTPISTQASTNVIDKAYSCLQTQINNKAETAISLQEAVFGTLALGSNPKLRSVIESKAASSGNYWAESSTSQIKDTAQVLLAYERINRNTEAIETWLKSNRRTATDLNWYLQIDIQSHSASQCTLSYGGEQKTIHINDEMVLSGNPGSCLTIAQSGFWLRVNNNCIDQNFTVSCDQDFITTTIYQRSSSSTIFISPITHAAAGLGTTQESLNSKCFSTTSTCDYEGTLWAALALDSTNNDISDYLPYLLALSESNPKFLPSGFLSMLINGQDQYSNLVQAQQQGKFWQAPNSPYGRHYDSAIALLALHSSSATEKESSKSYFETIPTSDGCWNNNNIRDTGFLLYAGWPRPVATGPGPSQGSLQNCEESGYDCMTLFQCTTGLNGTNLEDYDCSSGICCSNSLDEQTCAEQEGKICGADESCSGTESSASDGTCCLADCNPISQNNACEQAGGSCYSSCNLNEEQIPKSCDADSSEICCQQAQTKEGGTNWTLWIILLVILIALAVTGILMRDKIKLALYKFKAGASTPPTARPGVPPGGRPPFPPARGPIPMMRAPPPRIIQGQMPPSRRPGVSKSDTEMEETMRKLKEMGK